MPPWILNVINHLEKITNNYQLPKCLYTGNLSHEECLKIYDSIIEDIQKIRENLSEYLKKNVTL